MSLVANNVQTSLYDFEIEEEETPFANLKVIIQL